MTTPTPPHSRPSSSPPSPSDSDPDSDLDLQELDPIAASSSSSRALPHRRSRDSHRTPSSSSVLQALGGRIPLRNLRRGHRNTITRRENDDEEEDLRGLVEDEDGDKRDSAGESLGGDDAPLLAGGGPGRTRRRGSREGEREREEQWRVRRRRGGWSEAGGVVGRMVDRVLGRSARRRAGVYHPDEDEDGSAEPEAPLSSPSTTRTVLVAAPPSAQPARYPSNAISNAKYTPVSFLPRTLYAEFSFFFNLYFLLVALSQAIPPLKIGYLSTYVAPLAFVLAITLGKEAWDDIARRRRDAEANGEGFTVVRFWDPASKGGKARGKNERKRTGAAERQRLRRLAKGRDSANERLTDAEDEEQAVQSAREDELAGNSSYEEITKPARDLRVGDVLRLQKDQRVPADLVLLKTFAPEPLQKRHDIDAASAVPAATEPTSPEALIETADEDAAATSSTSKPLPSPPSQQEAAKDDSGGEAFIRTDQLDGETDWKLRLAAPLSQTLPVGAFTRLRVVAGAPDKKVNDFVGTLELLPPGREQQQQQPAGGGAEEGAEADAEEQTRSVPLSIDNTAWANTVMASSGAVLGVVVYTGRQTRQALSTAPSRSKTGLLEYEINALTKILCFLTLAVSFVLVALEGFEPRADADGKEPRKWYVNVMRFLILFSTIIPISLRVNLDMGKSVYAWFIERDKGIPGTVVRTSTIPEDLGRIEYLLSDKTGTLTQNEMEMKKIHVGTVSYANEAMDEVTSFVRHAFSPTLSPDSPTPTSASTLVTPSSAYTVPTTSATRTRREIGSRVRDVVLALALCHNVTPTADGDPGPDGQPTITYQASSPDEIAIVRWCEAVGLRLAARDRTGIALAATTGPAAGKIVVKVKILNVFPFTSEGKRMGIVVQFLQGTEKPGQASPDGEDIWFFQKGADTVMSSIVAANDWLDEETANMAREGLRTLVVGRKKLSGAQYADFSRQHAAASLALQGRDAAMAGAVAAHLERGLELLGVTGVEDKLQRDVKPSLELLRNAGIRIWMLTGDKVETARCVAVSSKLVARGQQIHTVARLRRKDGAHAALALLQSNPQACLLIDGESLGLMLGYEALREDFIALAVRLPAVVACRCAPGQKAELAKLIRAHTRRRVACIGDGGNDVAMIQAADVGVGIVGKEGRQASLAADFSIEQFCYLVKLLVWHGRCSYKRSAKLAQFVIHRGLIIAVCQTVYSVANRFGPDALYRDWLLVGYATIYTSLPVFSLVLDRDVDESLAALYPELYKELTPGQSLSYRTFFIWVAVSIYQGTIIQGLSQILVPPPPNVNTDDGEDPTPFDHDLGVNSPTFPRMVAVSFTVLVLNELVMVAAEITTWHWIMAASIVGTAAIYVASVPFLGDYFELKYVASVGFFWRVAVIAGLSLGPPYIVKLVRRRVKPPSYRKVQGV
ncbi:hypothetical protein BDY21DRAFT_383248 [Lineolata rhizophorae]|uniref:Phospholipid-transporting ATPase n=1 Tax=Lineolata rhizophorae TaxID=578093 RepID=A0A6A6PFZ3_9PEZI|nr:hypothetical protein BDY21DRAFT_383248 [Lineolata rhizophorae]